MTHKLLSAPYRFLVRRMLAPRPGGHQSIVELPARGTTRGRLSLSDELIALALKAPADCRRSLESLARERFGPDTDLDRDVTLSCPSEIAIPHDRLWQSEAEKCIERTSSDLVARLDSYNHEGHGKHIVDLDRAFFSKYLYMNSGRVLNLYRALQRKGFRGGSVLEIGSYFGSFALTLQRLGYQVTAVDRYRSYGDGFSAYTDLMEREGVRVVSTCREDEEAVIASLGTFDCVISTAVIEHIPHTPREFLRMLAGRCRPGALLCLDTPNLTRWWNRQKFNRGESVFQDLKKQYFCEIPYEGHHREYTGAEMVWLLEQVGCADVELTYFDFNMLQFPAIDRPHVECLLNLVRDVSSCDTILVCGQNARTP
jgi:2-polyprenyl-3-methyl-5-hydroxy-6-metoxy-1,4-benzoquinol methylase